MTRSRRASRRSRRSARRTASRSTRPRTRRSSPTRTSRSTTSSSGMSTTGDVLNDDPAGRVRALHARPAAATRASTPPPTPSTRGPGTARCSARTSATTRTARRPRRSSIEDADEPSTTGIPASWTRADEWYNFQKPNDPVVGGNQAGIPDYSPRTSGVHVLATVDESTYDEVDDSAEADDHPISWCSNFDGGRVWYTGLGHTQATFSEPDFLKHLLGGLKTAAGAVDADCGPSAHRAAHQQRLRARDARQGRRQDRRADLPRRAAGPPRPAHRARRPRLADDAELDHLAGRADQRLLARRGRPAGRRGRPRLRDQQVGLPVLRAAPDARR